MCSFADVEKDEDMSYTLVLLLFFCVSEGIENK